MSIKADLRQALFEILSRRYAKAAGGNLHGRLKNVSIKNLTEEQKHKIRKTWASFTDNPDWRYWTLYNSLECFDPAMVPDDIFVKDIIRTLNPIRMVYALQTKSNYPFLYDKLNKPRTVLRGINGIIYDESGKIIEDAGLKKVLTDYSEKTGHGSFIVKPTGSYGGMGVKKVDLAEIKGDRELIKMLDAMNRCFVCQELVRQSPVTSAFNQSSLNTFRINTLNINGNITSTNILFRHGRKGSIVDNGGSGGICCGVTNDGRFTGEAYDTSLSKYVTSPMGIPYRDITISEVPKMVEYAIDAHRKYLLMMGHCAWDFGLDENNNPVFIEVNLGWPGIVIEQLACKAPIYGDRTEEVLAYVSKNKHKLTWTEFTGEWI